MFTGIDKGLKADQSVELTDQVVNVASSQGKETSSLSDPILRSMFAYCLDSPRTIKNLTLSCWQFRHLMTSHPFVVLADSIYRLGLIKDENDVPNYMSTLYQPEGWIWNTFTQEQKNILQELPSDSMSPHRNAL